MSSNSNRNSLSQLYEKSLKKVSGVYIQTKQNSLKLLSTLNINLANRFNDNNNPEIEQDNDNLENKENKWVDSRPPYFNPLTPYQVENYHNFISDVQTSCLINSKEHYYNDDDDNVNSQSSPCSPLYKNGSLGQLSLSNPCSPITRNLYSRKSPRSINEKDFSDQESSDDQDDYFSSRKRSNYSIQSSSSSVSTSYGISELALTPLSNDKSDDGYEIINEEDFDGHIEQGKIKEKILRRKKSTIKSITSQKSDRSIKSNKSISKLSLKLIKNKSSSSSMTTDNSIGTINFEEFISSLDISEDIEGRLQWLFRFYDNDGDGFITRDEMLQIMHTLYS